MGIYVLGLQEIDQTQVAMLAGREPTWGSSRGSKASASRLASA